MGGRSSIALFTLMMVVLGFLLVGAVRSSRTLAGSLSSGDQRADLVQVVQQLEGKRETLEAELAQSRQEMAQLGEMTAASRGLRDEYLARVDTLSMEAGLVAVEGPGVRLTLADNPRPPENGGDPGNYIVHDYDLRLLVNALWSGGAEALAINDERLTTMSGIRCVGTTILVNSRRVASPFVIEAIGDREELAVAVENDPDALLLLGEQVGAFGLGYRLEKAETLSLPAYSGRLAPSRLELAGE